MADILSTRRIGFENGRIARAVCANVDSPPQEILRALALNSQPNGVISISGGATIFPKDPVVIGHTQKLMRSVINLAFDEHLMLIDGGTETGVMQILGQNFTEGRVKFSDEFMPPLVGFAPAPLVTYPNSPLHQINSDLANLDRNHPLFVLVNNAIEWGDEVDCMFEFVNYLSKSMPSLSVVANGGPTTLREAAKSVEQGRKIVVLRGSTRAAVVIVAALDGKPESELVALLEESKLFNRSSDNAEKLERMLKWLRKIAKYENLTCFDLHDTPEAFANKLKQLLGFDREK